MEKLLLTYFCKRLPIVFALDRWPAQITKNITMDCAKQNFAGL